MFNSFKATFVRMFVIDLRSLAIFRIALGIIFVHDLWLRAGSIAAHYCEGGVLPQESHTALNWSLHALFPTPPFQLFLFFIGGLAGLALIAGFHTRLAALCCWCWIISIHNHNSIVLYGGDTLMRLLLFWSVFLPVGSKFSFDAKRKPMTQNSYCSFASMSLLIQISIVYFFTGLLKSGNHWRVDFSALHFALSLDWFATQFGLWLSHFPRLLEPLTVIALIIEIAAPFLLLSPFLQMRRLGVTAIFFLQIGIAMTLQVGTFPIISIVALIPFLPFPDWATMKERHESQDRIAISESLVNNTASLYFICIALFWNCALLSGDLSHLSSSFKKVGMFLRLDQEWRMFAPNIETMDGWYVVYGESKDGRKENLLWNQDKEVSLHRPSLVTYLYPDHHWHKMFWNMRNEPNGGEVFQQLAKYLCHISRTSTVSVVYFRVPNRALGEEKPREDRKIDRSCQTIL